MYARMAEMVKHEVTGHFVSSKSKTGDPKCSQAVSAWKTGKATSETHHQLALCRSMAQTAAKAHRQRAAGHEARAQHFEHLLRTGAPLSQTARHEQVAQAQAMRESGRIRRFVKNRDSGRIPTGLEEPKVGHLPEGQAGAAQAVQRQPLSPVQTAARDATEGVMRARMNYNTLREKTSDPDQLGQAAEIVKHRYADAQVKLKAARAEQQQQAGTPQPAPIAPHHEKLVEAHHHLASAHNALVTHHTAQAAEETPQATPLPAAAPAEQKGPEIPERVRQWVQRNAEVRMNILQNLRRGRYMATVESGKGAGKVDLESLRRERQKAGITAEGVRKQRAASEKELKAFRGAAPTHGVDPEAEIRGHRERQKEELKERPQFLSRGAGYYPAAHEPGEIRDRNKERARREQLNKVIATVPRMPAPSQSPKPPEPTPAPAEKPFGLAQQSSVGHKKTTFESTGGTSRPGFLFDMKKGDLPGQTSMFDVVGGKPRVGTVDTREGTPAAVKAPAPASKPAVPLREQHQQATREFDAIHSTLEPLWMRRNGLEKQIRDLREQGLGPKPVGHQEEQEWNRRFKERNNKLRGLQRQVDNLNGRIRPLETQWRQKSDQAATLANNLREAEKSVPAPAPKPEAAPAPAPKPEAAPAPAPVPQAAAPTSDSDQIRAERKRLVKVLNDARRVRGDYDNRAKTAPASERPEWRRKAEEASQAVLDANRALTAHMRRHADFFAQGAPFGKVKPSRPAPKIAPGTSPATVTDLRRLHAQKQAQGMTSSEHARKAVVDFQRANKAITKIPRPGEPGAPKMPEESPRQSERDRLEADWEAKRSHALALDERYRNIIPTPAQQDELRAARAAVFAARKAIHQAPGPARAQAAVAQAAERQQARAEAASRPAPPPKRRQTEAEWLEEMKEELRRNPPQGVYDPRTGGHWTGD
jgi:hypothetical protein